MIKIGVIGVGDLTEKMVRGMHRAKPEVSFHLSSRNSVRSDRLAQEFGCKVWPTNQDVVEACDVVLVGVRPAQLTELAAQVKLLPNQPLISVIAGVKVDELQRLFGVTGCSRAMLSAASEINQSTVAVYPAASMASELLAPLGNIIPLDKEGDFELATVSACMNGWVYFLMHEMQQWVEKNGLSPDISKALVLSTFEDSVAYARHKSSKSIGEIGSSIALPGTYTNEGVKVLTKLGGLSAWSAACDRVFNLLENR